MTGNGRIITPGGADPNTPTVWVCNRCGATSYMVTAFVQAVTDAHAKVCIGPTLHAIARVLGADVGGNEAITDPTEAGQ